MLNNNSGDSSRSKAAASVIKEVEAQWKMEYEKLLQAYKCELKLRRTLHNQI
jgi:hypothetical protein